jgi:hypothetical protein
MVEIKIVVAVTLANRRTIEHEYERGHGYLHGEPPVDVIKSAPQLIRKPHANANLRRKADAQSFGGL